LQVRLVKGAYWDTETVHARANGWLPPVYEHKDATDASYERCVRVLVSRAHEVRPAFATHNLRSIAYAVATARAAGLRDDAFEVQLLYGMAEPVHAALRRLGLRVRVYCPIGALVPGMAYLVRRLLENTSNESFVRHRFAEGQALRDLVAAPDAAVLTAEDAAAEDAASQGRAAAAVPATDPNDPGAFANEPPAPLHRPSARARMARAVGARRAAPTFDAPVVVDGRTLDTPEHLDSVDPGDHARVVCRSGSAGAHEADLAVAALGDAARSWRATPPRERATVLFRAAAILRSRRDELAALEVFECGKPWPEADADVCEAIDFMEYYGRDALRLAGGGRALQAPGEANAYVYAPRGVTAVVAPWNFPLAIPAGMVTAALVTGNTVAFKPAEQSPGVAWRLVEALLEAGLPPGALAFLPGRGEDVGARLVAHPDVATIVFTGSRDVGLSIVRDAAATRPGQRHVKRVVAEMGGKNAVVVDADADLDQAVPGIVASAFGYAGQKCSAASRVVAHARVHDELAERLAGAARALVVGHAADPATTVGPVIDADAYARIAGAIARAPEEGDVLLARDDIPSGGWYHGPTIVALRDPRSSLGQDEIFGPVLALLRADDFDHALALANDTAYGLTAGVYSRSPSHVARALDTLHAGNLYVNRKITGAIVGRHPFGGIGLSGVGSKAGGPDYLLQLVEPRSISENTVRQGFAPLD
jgi:RHH-type proline utilization regulon transcriptional repressor/proline dehydrogenase/delta 1-pyrroline-5-carboxylate dehydrogenase